MLHRFGTYEEAALFVAKMRSEGFYAEVLHDNASALWGPLAMTGVAAWVSEEAAEEGDEVSQMEAKGPVLPRELSMTAALMMVGVPVIGLVALFISVFRNGAVDPTRAASVIGVLLLVLLLCIVVLGMLALFAKYLSGWTHAIWSKPHHFHEHATLLHAVIAFVLILIATDLGAWVLWTLVEFIYFRGLY